MNNVASIESCVELAAQIADAPDIVGTQEDSSNDPALMFDRGKTEEPTEHKGTADEAEACASSFLQHRSQSVKEEVTSGLVLHRGIAALRKDKAKLHYLVNALLEAKALSKADAELGLDAKKSTLSMLLKIGQHADIILHDEIVPFLQPGYSVLYQLALLIEDLEAKNG